MQAEHYSRRLQAQGRANRFDATLEQLGAIVRRMLQRLARPGLDPRERKFLRGGIFTAVAYLVLLTGTSSRQCSSRA
jgi:hypothetical protein